MLEEYEFAKKRGANILGEVMGFTCNNNGGDLILPNLKGITNTLKLGLENAKINPQDVDLISAMPPPQRWVTSLKLKPSAMSLVIILMSLV